MKGKITKTSVDELREQAIAAGKTVYFWDSELTGFGMLATAKGSMSYFVEYRLGGRGSPNKRIAIAKHGHKTPAEARTLAKVKLGEVADGKDVAQIEKEKRSKFAAGTLRDLVERYLGVKARETRYWRETKRLLEQNLLQQIGSKPIATVTKGDIAGAVGKAGERSHAAARNVFAAVRPLFAWAHDVGIIEANPIAGMKGPDPLKSRDRVLSDDELVAFWRATGRMGGVFAPIFRLALLLGQRREEIAGLRWDELDLDRAAWTIPGERCKNGKPHSLDLSPQALAILRELHANRIADCDLVFSTTGVTSVSGFSNAKEKLDKLMTEEFGKPVKPWRTHDLRRVAASGMAGLGFAPQVIERVLNHVSGVQSGLVGVYQRHEYRAERKAALLAWGSYVENLTNPDEPANVVPFPRVASAAE
jgi:integrase